MFGWFKKKERPEDTQAFHMGQKASQAMAAAVDEYIESRFNPAFSGYLRVFNQCLDEVYRDDAPPIMVARADYRVFMNNVDDMQTKMIDEIRTVMREWVEVAESLGSIDLFEKYISQRAGEFCTRLKTTGLQQMIDRADELKACDDEWRRDNPQKSAEYPPD